MYTHQMATIPHAQDTPVVDSLYVCCITQAGKYEEKTADKQICTNRHIGRAGCECIDLPADETLLN